MNELFETEDTYLGNLIMVNITNETVGWMDQTDE